MSQRRITLCRLGDADCELCGSDAARNLSGVTWTICNRCSERAEDEIMRILLYERERNTSHTERLPMPMELAKSQEDAIVRAVRLSHSRRNDAHRIVETERHQCAKNIAREVLRLAGRRREGVETEPLRVPTQAQPLRTSLAENRAQSSAMPAGITDFPLSSDGHRLAHQAMQSSSPRGNSTSQLKRSRSPELRSTQRSSRNRTPPGGDSPRDLYT